LGTNLHHIVTFVRLVLGYNTIQEMIDIGAIKKTQKGNYKLTDVAQYVADWVMMKFYSPEITKQIDTASSSKLR